MNKNVTEHNSEHTCKDYDNNTQMAYLPVRMYSADKMVDKIYQNDGVKQENSVAIQFTRTEVDPQNENEQRNK